MSIVITSMAMVALIVALSLIVSIIVYGRGEGE